MSPSPSDFAGGAAVPFHFRPWVRRAGASIVLVAAAITAAAILVIVVRPSVRFGWIREPFVWVYIGTLWLGGAKILGGTFQPIAEVGEDNVVLRPLHQFLAKRVPWSAIRGTEQVIGGDRLILYYESAKGMRFVALNLNLVKGRREFLTLLDRRLEAMGFAEKVVERSRYLSRG